MPDKKKRGIARVPGLPDGNGANDVCWCDELGEDACPVHGEPEDEGEEP